MSGIAGAAAAAAAAVPGIAAAAAAAAAEAHGEGWQEAYRFAGAAGVAAEHDYFEELNTSAVAPGGKVDVVDGMVVGAAGVPVAAADGRERRRHPGVP